MNPDMPADAEKPAAPLSAKPEAGQEGHWHTMRPAHAAKVPWVFFVELEQPGQPAPAIPQKPKGAA